MKIKKALIHVISRRSLIVVIFIVIIAAIAGLKFFPEVRYQSESNHQAVILPEISQTVFDKSFALSTLERRCVVCHGCYDAPCQLKLSSPAGIARGASKQSVYAPSRHKDAPLTRLGIDASSVDQWREMGFFDVTNEANETTPNSSNLGRMLALGMSHPLPDNTPLPKSIDIDINRDLTCPAPSEFDSCPSSYKMAQIMGQAKRDFAHLFG